MLELLSRSLFEAISDSEDVHEHLRQLREEGYSLNLLLDCQPDSEDEEESDAFAARYPDGDETSEVSSGAIPAQALPRSGVPPVFRIDGKDLAFLRDLGIDPTRRCKSRSRQRRLPAERLPDDS